jgi:hypothetical protein
MVVLMCTGHHAPTLPMPSADPMITSRWRAHGRRGMSLSARARFVSGPAKGIRVGVWGGGGGEGKKKLSLSATERACVGGGFFNGGGRRHEPNCRDGVGQRACGLR